MLLTLLTDGYAENRLLSLSWLALRCACKRVPALPIVNISIGWQTTYLSVSNLANVKYMSSVLGIARENSDKRRLSVVLH